ncbi:MAG: glycosyltransferase [Proteobacteria bacterium]|nr:glycosyltransferase [Pseudomonadota bacterium]
MRKRASVLISTYNNPAYLDLVLRAYRRQTCLDFEIVLADDGSGSETRAVVEKHAARHPARIRHVWHPDQGFRKARAMNRAALASEGDWLIFSDGDCLPSRTFVEEHLGASENAGYIVGGHIRLSREYSATLDPEAVESGEYESRASVFERLSLWGLQMKSLAYIAAHKRRKPKFYGLNFSVGRSSFFALNGFDQNFVNSGKDDSDLRNRMQLAGLPPRSLWHRARVFHMWHPGHATRGGWKEAHAYYNRPDLRCEAPNGLRELTAEEGLSLKQALSEGLATEVAAAR